MGRKPKGWADARAMPEVHQNIRVFMRVIQNRIPKAGKKSRAKPEVLQNMFTRLKLCLSNHESFYERSP
jgi:hypothetical protein